MDLKFYFWVIVAIVVITAFLRTLFSGNLRKNLFNDDPDLTGSFFDSDDSGFEPFDINDDP